jgi:uncharacterized membrane protein (UPF0127 family)
MRFLHLSNKKNLLFPFILIVVAIIVSWIFLAKPLYPIMIHTADKDFPLRVELADTPKKLEKGLMYRTSLAPDKGMLFVFPNEQKVSFWMKNTLIPLDMLFIKSNGKIDFIHHNAKPQDETPIPSPDSISAVLEIAGGQADKHHIKVGDTVSTPLITGSSK